MGKSGLIFDIQRFSVHDGPGIRTTVFFKGCSLRCFWCHNPEGIQPRAQIQYLENRCILCGECAVNCPEEAQVFSDQSHIYFRNLCQECGACIKICYADALQWIGREVDLSDVMAEVMADRAFYETSGGGVTLSGGDPVMQPEFAEEILRSCKENGIHTAIETAGNATWKILSEVIRFADLVMLDLKHMDPEKHRKVTGVDNVRILQNALNISISNKPLILRTPIVPGVNDTQEEIRALGKFVAHLADERRKAGYGMMSLSWELLTFHRLAADKYYSLGLDYPAKDFALTSKEDMAQLISAALESGVMVKYPNP